MNISVIIGAVIALACLFAAFRFLRKKRLVDDMPTSKTLGVFIGLAELKGTAESDKPLTSYLAGMPCVLYTWKIEEHWSRTVTSIGAKGVPTTRHESGWTVVAKDQQKAPFYLKDDTGVIRIIPDGAEIQDKQIFNKTCRFSDPLYFAKGPLKEIADSDHERRFTETAIPLHANLYIMGQARQREDIVAAEIAKDKNCPMFLVSTRTEKQISSGLGFWFWGLAGHRVAGNRRGCLAWQHRLPSFSAIERTIIFNYRWRLLAHHRPGLDVAGLQQPDKSAPAGAAGLV